MKKIFLPALLVLPLIIAIAPFIVGMKVKSSADDFIVQINENTAYQIEWISYKKGWLSSRGKLRAGLEFPGTENLTVEFDIDVNHGPFLKTEGLGWAAWNIQLEKA